MPDTQKNLHKKFLGFSGEGRAVRFLKRKGYKIVCKNYVCRVGEADVIAYDKETLVFIEVKTRLSEKYGRPSEAVNSAKQRKYRLIALYYLQSKDIEDIPVRFDVIEILGKEINHIENAF